LAACAQAGSGGAGKDVRNTNKGGACGGVVYAIQRQWQAGGRNVPRCVRCSRHNGMRDVRIGRDVTARPVMRALAVATCAVVVSMREVYQVLDENVGRVHGKCSGSNERQIRLRQAQ